MNGEFSKSAIKVRFTISFKGIQYFTLVSHVTEERALLVIKHFVVGSEV